MKNNLIGFFKGSAKNDGDYVDINTYYEYKNEISKDAIVKHLNTLNYGALLSYNYPKDIYNGNKIANYYGIAQDGKYTISNELIYYLKNYDIGIPPEYEEYLKKKGIK